MPEWQQKEEWVDGPDPIKVIEVAQPERMLDARSKTAMLTMATWADFFRVDEQWHALHRWRLWKHGKTVNEVSHFGEYTTCLGDVLAVCPLESDNIVCRVQVTEIRMVDCDRLTDQELAELGYTTREEYNSQWRDMAEGSARGWFMRVMLLSDHSTILQ